MDLMERREQIYTDRSVRAEQVRRKSSRTSGDALWVVLRSIFIIIVDDEVRESDTTPNLLTKNVELI